MNVFKAMLLDAYRELNSKKLFWVTLALSLIVVLVYGGMGFNDRGVFMFYGLWTIESEWLKAGTGIDVVLYRAIFSSFMVGMWLAWIATILALISTATVFPDFIAGGSIDLVLSKPIGRVRLFLYKYITSLLFVVLQVAVFCVGIFLCMGVRVGEWNPMIFAAIPLVTFFYSFLFAVSVLVGVLTRSAITAMLLTMLFWFMLFSLNMAEGIVNQIKTQMIVSNEGRTARVEDLKAELAEANNQQQASLQAEIAGIEQSINSDADTIAKIEAGHWPIRATQAVLPKTSETIGLLDRWLKKEGEVEFLDLLNGNITQNEDGEYVSGATQSRDLEVGKRIQEDYESRSMWYVLGTSAIFEGVLLFFACLVFVRKDF